VFPAVRNEDQKARAQDPYGRRTLNIDFALDVAQLEGKTLPVWDKLAELLKL